MIRMCVQLQLKALRWSIRQQWLRTLVPSDVNHFENKETRD